MRILGVQLLHDFMTKHADTKSWIECWIAEVKAVKWETPQDIKDRYASASFLADNRVFFNVRGNNYRLLCKVAYRNGVIVIEWAGTHAEYSKMKF